LISGVVTDNRKQKANRKDIEYMHVENNFKGGKNTA